MITCTVKDGIATARVLTENGYYAWITLGFLEDSAVELALNEYLDELGYDREAREFTDDAYKVEIRIPATWVK